MKNKVQNKSMISIHYSTDNQYTLYGINHFSQKYGIPIEVNSDERSRVDIIHGEYESKGDFVIQIRENEIQDEIKGWVRQENCEVPVFEKPFDLTSCGQTLARYHNGDEEYPCVAYSDDEVIIGFDIFKEIGCTLSGQLEKLWEDTDKEKKRRIARIPIVDYYGEIIFDSILYIL